MTPSQPRKVGEERFAWTPRGWEQAEQGTMVRYTTIAQVVTERDNLKTVSANLLADVERLRAALREIRDSTFRGSVTLRGMADRALRSDEPKVLRDKESGE